MKLFKTIKNIFKETPRFPEIEGEWNSAGILFTNNNTVLVGYKIIDDKWLVSGFGGKRNKDEQYYETAIRETLEELYEVTVTKEMIEYVARRLKITTAINNNGYILIICKLNKMNEFILAGVNAICYTPVYDNLPYSVTELIGKRKDRFYSEFHYLGLMSISMIISKTSPVEIDPNLISDMKYIKED